MFIEFDKIISESTTEETIEVVTESTETEEVVSEESTLDAEIEQVIAESAELQFNEEATSIEGDELIFECFKESGLLSEYQTSIVRIDKHTKIHRLTAQAAYIIAKEQNDPLFRKLEGLNDKRRVLKRKIEAKYGTRARKRAQEIVKAKGIGAENLFQSKDLDIQDPNKKAE
jgi:hypothetical protein